MYPDTKYNTFESASVKVMSHSMDSNTSSKRRVSEANWSLASFSAALKTSLMPFNSSFVNFTKHSSLIDFSASRNLFHIYVVIGT